MKTFFLLNILFIGSFLSFSQNDSILILDSFTFLPIESVKLFDLNNELINESNSKGILVLDSKVNKYYLRKEGFFDYQVKQKKDTIFLVRTSQEIEEITISPIDFEYLYGLIIKNSIETLHNKSFLYGQLIDTSFFISQNFKDTMYYYLKSNIKIQLSNKRNRLKKELFIGESSVYFSDSILFNSFSDYYFKSITIENFIDIILLLSKRKSKKTTSQNNRYKKYFLNSTMDSLSVYHINSRTKHYHSSRTNVSYNKRNYLFNTLQFVLDSNELKMNLLYQYFFENNTRKYKKCDLFFEYKTDIKKEKWQIITKKKFNLTEPNGFKYTRIKKNNIFPFLRKNAKFIKIP